MKKVLLGLVIAVMMTGSGYAKFDRKTSTFSNAECRQLIDRTKHSLQYKDSFRKAEAYAKVWSIMCD